MATQILYLNSNLSLETTIGDSPIGDRILLKMEHRYDTGESHRTDEAFLTLVQLELLGQFLIRQAQDMHLAKAYNRQLEHAGLV